MHNYKRGIVVVLLTTHKPICRQGIAVATEWDGMIWLFKTTEKINDQERAFANELKDKQQKVDVQQQAFLKLTIMPTQHYLLEKMHGAKSDRVRALEKKLNDKQQKVQQAFFQSMELVTVRWLNSDI